MSPNIQSMTKHTQTVRELNTRMLSRTEHPQTIYQGLNSHILLRTEYRQTVENITHTCCQGLNTRRLSKTELTQALENLICRYEESVILTYEGVYTGLAENSNLIILIIQFSSIGTIR